MSYLPRISGRDFVKAMHQFGYQFDHQTGSHMVLRRNRAPFRHLSVPDHRELATGLLRRLLRDAELSVEEFKAAL